MQRVFIIRPFGVKGEGADAIDFDRVHRELIGPALARAGLAGGTTGEIVEPGNIREDMFQLIVEADIVIADVTIHNANVFYELGIRHALRRRSTVLIRGGPVKDPTPFDILTDRYLGYPVADPAKKLDELYEVVQAALVSDRVTDSPVFKMVPLLPEVDPAVIHVVPKDLAEEIDRAAAARSPGWLRLLAGEVSGLRFQWTALRRIGAAQWGLGDRKGARDTWERIRANRPDDLVANLALADAYERQYRDEKRPELLEASNQAVARVLGSGRASVAQAAQALALKGRNLKTIWRLPFAAAAAGTLAERRAVASSRALLGSYRAYLDAYQADLNHYWSGLAALQMGVIALDLARDPSWGDMFDDEDAQQRETAALTAQVQGLRAMVPLSLDAADTRRPKEETDQWAAISRADLLFIEGRSVGRVAKAYQAAIPPQDGFALDSVRSQLRLFGSLGIRTEDAEAIVAQAVPASAQGGATVERHVVILAGHRVDLPDRSVPRFPETAVAGVRAAIDGALDGLRQDGRMLHVLASGASGTDIIGHEACSDLGIESTICLPMPRDVYGHLAFGALDAWRARLLRLMEARPVLELSDQAGLPRWLQQTRADPWERGNRWVLEMATSLGARRVTLLALWDGQADGGTRGGTAHMVDLARTAGAIDVKVIPVP